MEKKNKKFEIDPLICSGCSEFAHSIVGVVNAGKGILIRCESCGMPNMLKVKLPTAGQEDTTPKDQKQNHKQLYLG